MPDGALAPARAIGIAVLAMGGEGGGVLADWIVGLAEANGYIAQSTSVPGVAQRTGATIYYVEIFPEAAAAGRMPVLALMPAPGDVDIVIASELMEAARAVSRGLVTPGRTTLVASTHRVYSMTERTALGDGRADSARMLASCEAAAGRLVTADMRAIAEANGSVISAALFGGLAGSGALPFPRARFEDAIRAGGVGVERSLAAFAAGFAAAGTAPPAPLPQETLDIIAEGERRLRDYQDAAYAQDYRDRLAPLHGTGALLTETARHLALWMSYEDPIRVADLKTRAARFARVRAEVRLAPGQVLRIREWMHPRLEEIAETLPGGMGRWLLRTAWARSLVARATRRGRRVETTALWGFLLLRAVAAGRRWRRTTLRHAAEMAAIDSWLARIVTLATANPAMALEVAKLQRLVKGYSDTHARGRANFDTIMALEPKLDDPADLARLREAALADDTGAALKEACRALPCTRKGTVVPLTPDSRCQEDDCPLAGFGAEPRP